MGRGGAVRVGGRGMVGACRVPGDGTWGLVCVPLRVGTQGQASTGCISTWRSLLSRPPCAVAFPIYCPEPEPFLEHSHRPVSCYFSPGL